MGHSTWYIGAAVVASFVSYVLHTIYQEFCHARRARQWGCQPAFVRPSRLPLGIDILRRYLATAETNDSQNDDLILFEELGKRHTWYQQILGNWHHVTSEPKNIQAMLATQFSDFSLGPVRRGSMDPMLGAGIFTVDGKEWEHSRALLRPQFTRKQVSDLLLEEKHVQALLTRINASSPSDDWTDDLDLGPLFFNLTLDSSTEFLFGESVNSQNTDISRVDTELDAWFSFGHHFEEASRGTLTRMRLFDLYFLYNPPTFQRHCREIHKCVDHFVDLALQAREKPATGPYIFLHELAKVTTDRLELRSQALNILLAGRDTTAGLLGFTFYLLARHTDVYERLRKTILDHFGTGPENITFETLKSCTYLQDVMAEVGRFEPVVPENARRCVKNTTLPRGGGPNGDAPMYVRAGEEVMYNIRIMHRRQDLWGEDANEFNPDRWRKHRPGWEYLPFNGGPRVCIGQQFALTEAGYVITRMLQKYDKIESLDFKPMKHKFLQTASPLEVSVRLHKANV